MMSLSKEKFIQIFVENDDDGLNAKPAPKVGKFNAFSPKAQISKRGARQHSIRNFSRDLLAKIFADSFGVCNLTGEGNIIPRLSAASLHSILPEKADLLERKTPLLGPKYVISVEIEHERAELFNRARALFRDQGKIDCLEDVADRVANEIIQAVKTDTRDKDSRSIKADPEEILVAIAVKDDREKEKPDQASPWLISYYSTLSGSDSLEVFRLEERVRDWEDNTKYFHLSSIFERQFQKLPTDKWHDAFLTSEEREKAEKLVGLFAEKRVNEKEIQNKVVDLLEEIARGYGLKKNKQNGSRLFNLQLPKNHEIGCEDGQNKDKKGINPFPGLIVRDAEQRLLGYIIYCLDDEEKAQKLRENLQKNNRFHNVLLVYPAAGQLEIELYQGTERLEGRLRQNHLKFNGPGRIVNILSRYFVVSRAKVKNPGELAQELAYRARYLRDLAQQHLDNEPEKGELRDLFRRFKEALVHDIDEKKFADAYAQTLTYGLLTARLVGKDDYDPTKRFTRERALENFPSTSPFLHEFFQTVFKATFEDGERLIWLTDDIADLLDRTDLDKVFGEGDTGSDENSDPIIHFYEPFLGAYDAELRKSMGVYYTPKPVVSFIVRSVHEALQKEFGLEDGLASTITWGEYIKKNPEVRLPEHATDKTPFVQILDPATGTATFLVEVIDVIHQTMMQKWQNQKLDATETASRWQNYVEKDLIPRVHGFEMMMAPYAIAHLKFGLKLKETGVDLKNAGHAQIYLTNSLEMPLHDGHQALLDLSTDEMSNEARAVTELKEKGLFTIIIGNPPYCGESKFKGKWIMSLMEAYKKEPGGQNKLKEKNSKWINDDYVKFVRYGSFFIEQNDLGILGFINPHGFLDNPTFRGMRWRLLQTYNSLEIYDLHGNSNKQEVNPDGGADENVFFIQQGVSVNMFVRGPQAKPSKTVCLNDLFGLREEKFKKLNQLPNRMNSFKKFSLNPPFYYFKKNAVGCEDYYNWPSLKDYFGLYNSGVVTKRDKLNIHYSFEEACEMIDDMKLQREDFLRKKYSIPEDVRDWNFELALGDLRATKFDKNLIEKINYRPFDKRFFYYSGVSKGLVGWPVPVVSEHLKVFDNIGLMTNKKVEVGDFSHAIIYRGIVESHAVSMKEINYVFPLYLYSRIGKTHNFKPPIISKLEKSTGLIFNDSSTKEFEKTFGSVDVLNYIYSILSCPSFRYKFNQVLKIDFPRIPLPKDKDFFLAMAKKGRHLKDTHLLESPILQNLITQFSGIGNNLVTHAPKLKDGKVYINKTQYFEGLPEIAWNFYIGGYQPAQKWLKDRKGRVLTDEDIAHYQKIIVALTETDRIMKEIDEIIEKHGGLEGAFATGNED